MREWLTVIVVLLILGVLLDGWRRMRNNRRDSLRMPRSVYKPASTESDSASYTSELPNGGARVVGQRRAEPPVRTEPKFDPESTFDMDDDFGDEAEEETSPYAGVFESPQTAPRPAPTPQRKTAPQPKAEPESSRIPQQVTLNLDESVPMLMESIDDEEPANTPTAKSQRTDALSPTHQAGPGGQVEPSMSGKAQARASVNTAPPSEPMDELSEPEEVLIINIMAHTGSYFQGDALQQAIFDTGMRYGSMNIFHRYRDARGGGPALFSLANMVKPGTFDLDSMEQFQTPGVSLFMTLPMEGDNVAAFDLMLDTAKTLAETLDGELKDENRSVMTRQTMEHDRQRVLDFVRRQLSRVPG